MKKFFLIKHGLSCFFFYINQKFLLVFQNLNYQFFFINIPKNLTKCLYFCFKPYSQDYNQLFFSNQIGTLYEQSFFFFLNKIFLNLNRRFVQSLALRGTGFSMQINSLSVLELKLGFTHKIFLKIPKYLVVNIIKKKLFIEATNLQQLKNFIFLIKLKRPVNCYTGKGFIVKREKVIRKEVKKT